MAKTNSCSEQGQNLYIKQLDIQNIIIIMSAWSREILLSKVLTEQVLYYYS